MKKTCIITTAHPAHDPRIYFREGLSLAKKYNVILIAQNDSVEDGQIKIIPLKPTKSILKRFLSGYRAIIIAVKTKSDIYHIHDFELLLWGALLKVITRKPVIYDSHEFFLEVLDNRKWAHGIKKIIIKFGIRLYHNTFIHFFDRVIVANPLQKDSYKNSEIILNLPPRSNYIKFYKDKSYQNIAYIGSITNDRGAKNMEEIAKLLGTNYRINLVGEAVDDVSGKNVHKFGYVNNDKVSGIVSDSGIGIVPFLDKRQYHLSIPSKVFDYMAMGMAVILPTFVKESFKNLDISKNLIFIEGTPQSFVDKITELQKNKKKIESISKLNRNNFLEKFNWDNEEKKLLNIYSELLK